MKTSKLKILVASALLFMTASAPALQPEVLYAFQAGSTNSNGAYPQAGLVLGRDGHFYGTTEGGGSNGDGTVFKVTRDGVLTTLVSFNGANGSRPQAELLLSRDGSFYGTTIAGGSSGNGTVFQVTTSGALTSLVSFSGANGSYPQSALVLGSDGDLYGTTAFGGSSGFAGTVFRVTTNGILTSLFSFTGDDGRHPSAGLVLDRDGNLFGTTPSTVFRVTTSGVLTTLVTFSGPNGSDQSGELWLNSDGNFYGTTYHGGSSGIGTVFKITTNGTLATLVSFGAFGAGSLPVAGLVVGGDGNFYGTTAAGGSGGGLLGSGTVFKVTPNGVLTSLVSFNGTNGRGPNKLVLGPDGNLYGTTVSGGPGGGGTIFRLVISAFTRVARQPGGSVLLTGNGPTNGAYSLWASTDLSLPVASWTLLTSHSFDSNGNFSYTDASAANNSSRFYQISVP